MRTHMYVSVCVCTRGLPLQTKDSLICCMCLFANAAVIVTILIIIVVMSDILSSGTWSSLC